MKGLNSDISSFSMLNFRGALRGEYEFSIIVIVGLGNIYSLQFVLFLNSYRENVEKNSYDIRRFLGRPLTLKKFFSLVQSSQFLTRNTKFHLLAQR